METLTLERNNIHSKPNLVISDRRCTYTSKCSFCAHYQLQRGSVGHCQLLNAPVRGGWKSCTLAMPPFAPSWEHVESANVFPGAFVN
ncbi:hypothetical protein IQ270_20625 [Microcoleus sp. LEGE 07076]|uniref:hypothetical protein n=1 Tax=Microcoleus sp. LEGE 07076 TaxID=915322 RepID=UPI001882457F|nr:hypothetical protein [Microcoleus sp. LEGE 07076]MBE9186993.1 hypothetical protein [Microcoleus sp. LEGE 07076]